MLCNKNLVLRIYTQNVDLLERSAGISEDKMINAHGTIEKGHCIKCHAQYSLNWMKSISENKNKIKTTIFFKILFCKETLNEKNVLNCLKCCDDRYPGGYVKPDVVFFGESLTKEFLCSFKEDFQKCDLLIVMGTSLKVPPFCNLVHKVKPNCPRLLINNELVGPWVKQNRKIKNGKGFDKISHENYAYILGDCDEICSYLTDRLGLKDELDELSKSNFDFESSSNEMDVDDKLNNEDILENKIVIKKNIPSKCVGWIIGRQGATVNQVLNKFIDLKKNITLNAYTVYHG